MGLKEKNQDTVKNFRKLTSPSRLNKKLYYVSNQELTLNTILFHFLKLLEILEDYIVFLE